MAGDDDDVIDLRGDDGVNDMPHDRAIGEGQQQLVHAVAIARGLAGGEDDGGDGVIRNG